MKMKYMLNIAAGKLKPLSLDPTKYYALINLDTMYYNGLTGEEIENQIDIMEHGDLHGLAPFHELKCNEDVFSFMERTTISFEHIACYRFLEHVTFTQVSYFIYLMSTCLNVGGTVDVIVPNYATLADMITNEDVFDMQFEDHNILLTTELLNEPSCPHASIWTPDRVKYYFEALEGRFKIQSLDEAFDFDGRDIYIRAIVERIK